jgi:hypothetical protein
MFGDKSGYKNTNPFLLNENQTNSNSHDSFLNNPFFRNYLQRPAPTNNPFLNKFEYSTRTYENSIPKCDIEDGMPISIIAMTAFTVHSSNSIEELRAKYYEKKKLPNKLLNSFMTNNYQSENNFSRTNPFLTNFQSFSSKPTTSLNYTSSYMVNPFLKGPKTVTDNTYSQPKDVNMALNSSLSMTLNIYSGLNNTSVNKTDNQNLRSLFVSSQPRPIHQVLSNNLQTGNVGNNTVKFVVEVNKEALKDNQEINLVLKFKN